jgi:Tfp pilus assembly protein FimV
MRPRWSRWALVVGVGAALGTVPVAARTNRDTPRPPLAVEVRYGDSLWTLARRHGDRDRDVRETVAGLMRANSVRPGQLQPGSVLLLPADCLPDR